MYSRPSMDNYGQPWAALGIYASSSIQPGVINQQQPARSWSQEPGPSNQQPTQPRRPNSTVEQQSSASSRNQEASGASDHKQGSHQPPASQQSPSSQETSLEPMEGANSNSHWQPDHPAFNLQPAASSHQVPVSCLQPI